MTNDPIAPAPCTTTTSPGRTRLRSTACMPTARGWASAALSSETCGGDRVQHRLGNRHPLGQPAVGREPVGPVGLAQVRLAAAAPVAVAARDAGAGRDPVADGQAVDARTDGVDDADELVPEHDRAQEAARGVPVLQRRHHRAGRVLAQVGAAEAGARHRQLDLTRTGLRRARADPRCARHRRSAGRTPSRAGPVLDVHLDVLVGTPRGGVRVRSVREGEPLGDHRGQVDAGCGPGSAGCPARRPASRWCRGSAAAWTGSGRAWPRRCGRRRCRCSTSRASKPATSRVAAMAAGWPEASITTLAPCPPVS